MTREMCVYKYVDTEDIIVCYAIVNSNHKRFFFTEKGKLKYNTKLFMLFYGETFYDFWKRVC